MTPASGILGELLAPLSAEEFLTEYYGQRMLCQPGSPARFARPGSSLARRLAYQVEAEVSAELCAPDADGSPVRVECSVIFLQVAGECTVRVFRDRPSRGEMSVSGPRAHAHEDEPEWEGSLAAGTLLYLPGCYWLQQSPRSAAEQLRLRIQNPTGKDLLRWLCQFVEQQDAFEQDLPLFAGPGAQAERLDTLRRTIARALRDPHVLLSFRRQRNKNAKPHPQSGARDLPDADLISIAAAFRPRIRRHSDDEIRIPFDGRQVIFPEEAAPLLHFLIDRAPVPIGEFFAHFEPGFDREELRDLLDALSREGVIDLRRQADV